VFAQGNSKGMKKLEEGTGKGTWENAFLPPVLRADRKGPHEMLALAQVWIQASETTLEDIFYSPDPAEMKQDLKLDETSLVCHSDV